MGDRANILIKDGKEQVCLYTHWSGYNLPTTLQKALLRGKSRWDDFQYLTRIIFCEMVGGAWEETIGYGISQQVHDGGDKVIVVDSKEGTVQLPGQPPVTFSDYTQNKATW